MFYGSLPASARSMLLETVQPWGSTEVATLYSGDFAVERSLRGLGLRCHACDASLYGAALGAAFTSTPFPITVRPEYTALWGWLADWLDTPERAAPTVQLMASLVTDLTGNNRFRMRQREAIETQWPRMHEQTSVRLAAANPSLASYTVADPLAHLATLPADLPVILGSAYPDIPILDDLFTWEAPVVNPDLNALPLLLERPRWVAILTERQPDLDDRLIGYISRCSPPDLYLYGSAGSLRVEMIHRTCTPPPWPKIMPGETPTAPLEIVPLEARAFNGLRAEFLNPAIAPREPSYAAAILAGGKVIGAYAVSDDSGPTRQTYASQAGFPAPGVFLLSDFPVVSGRDARLAKLVLLAALSRESQLLIERKVRHRVRSLVTIAYSERSASMKYRGLFALTKRAPGARTAFELHYAARLGDWPLAEALTRWESMR